MEESIIHSSRTWKNQSSILLEHGARTWGCQLLGHLSIGVGVDGRALIRIYLMHVIAFVSLGGERGLNFICNTNERVMLFLPTNLHRNGYTKTPVYRENVKNIDKFSPDGTRL